MNYCLTRVTTEMIEALSSGLRAVLAGVWAIFAGPRDAMRARLWVLSVAYALGAERWPERNSSAFDALPPPPSPMPPEPSPPPPPQPQPPEPSPPSPEPSLPPGYGHNHPVQQHSFPVEVMPYQIAVEEPTLAVQVLVSMSSLTAMLFLSLVT